MTEEYGSVGLLFSDFTKLFQDDSTYYMTVRTVWVWLHHVWTKILYEKRSHPFLVACGYDWTKAENLHIIRKLPHLCPLTAIERGSKYFLKHYFHKINCFTICKLCSVLCSKSICLFRTVVSIYEVHYCSSCISTIFDKLMKLSAFSGAGISRKWLFTVNCFIWMSALHVMWIKMGVCAGARVQSDSTGC